MNHAHACEKDYHSSNEHTGGNQEEGLFRWHTEYHSSDRSSPCSRGRKRYRYKQDQANRPVTSDELPFPPCSREYLGQQTIKQREFPKRTLSLFEQEEKWQNRKKVSNDGEHNRCKWWKPKRKGKRNPSA